MHLIVFHRPARNTVYQRAVEHAGLRTDTGAFGLYVMLLTRAALCAVTRRRSIWNLKFDVLKKRRFDQRASELLGSLFMNSHRIVDDRLTLLELPQTLEGYNRFLGSWVYSGDVVFVVDVGPACSANHLIQYLEQRNLKRLDAILLTHIHIDHAGGLSQIMDAFPETPVICHDKAIKNLAQPYRLWEASKEALGPVAVAYGEMKPVEESRLFPHSSPRVPGLTGLATPGHAPHHVCFCYDTYLFAGEAGGVHLPEDDPGYLRPSTPPRFILEKALDSIDALCRLEDRLMCYGHFGWAESSHEMLKQHRAQLLFWRDLVKEERRGAKETDALESCLERLEREDPWLKGMKAMSPGDRERERFFLRNSLRGYLGYLESVETQESVSR